MSTPLEAGQIFASDYKIVKPLGAGGMGSIYVVEQLSTGNLRALKLMHAQLLSDPRLRARFLQEARVGSQIASDHIVQVLAAGDDPTLNVPWLIMELLQGEELEERVKRAGPLPPRELAQVMTQLCHALSAAHAVGVVHRDLKPNNLFLCKPRVAGASMQLKVLDFGIAKVMAEAQTTGTSGLGTPLWMAPEQTDNVSHVGPGTDLWAAGLIAFWALTGQIYWVSAEPGNTSVTALLREMLIDPIVPPSMRARNRGRANLIPQGFDAWFLRCVERNRDRRFRSADEALAELLPILQGAAATPVPAAPAGQPVSGTHLLTPGTPHQSAPPGTFASAPLLTGMQPPVGASYSAPPAAFHTTAATPPGHAVPNYGSYNQGAHPNTRPKSKDGLVVALVVGAVALGGLAVGVLYLAGEHGSGHHRSHDDDDDDSPRKRSKSDDKDDARVQVEGDTKARTKAEQCAALVGVLTRAKSDLQGVNAGPNPGPAEMRAVGYAFDSVATATADIELSDEKLKGYANDYSAMASEGARAATAMAEATEAQNSGGVARAKSDLQAAAAREQPLIANITSYCAP